MRRDLQLPQLPRHGDFFLLCGISIGPCGEGSGEGSWKDLECRSFSYSDRGYIRIYWLVYDGGDWSTADEPGSPSSTYRTFCSKYLIPLLPLFFLSSSSYLLLLLLLLPSHFAHI